MRTCARRCATRVPPVLCREGQRLLLVRPPAVMPASPDEIFYERCRHFDAARHISCHEACLRLSQSARLIVASPDIIDAEFSMLMFFAPPPRFFQLQIRQILRHYLLHTALRRVFIPPPFALPFRYLCPPPSAVRLPARLRQQRYEAFFPLPVSSRSPSAFHLPAQHQFFSEIKRRRLEAMRGVRQNSATRPHSQKSSSLK